MPDTSIGGGGRDFPVTSWQMILAAGDPEDPERLRSLERLIRRYWKPAYHYIRAAGRRNVEDAKDLTQDFFARLLEKNSLERVTADRGNFRGYLKRSLRNFVIDASRRDKARSPHGGELVFRFEPGDEPAQPADLSLSPEALFDREWAREVLKAAIEDLRLGMKEKGQEETFEVFRLYCLEAAPESQGKSTYKDVAERLHVSETIVRKRLERCREDLRDLVRQRIRDYLKDESDLDAEFREILGR